MEGLENLTSRFTSWGNLVNATAVLEKEGIGNKYDCNWCNSGCGGCAGCGDSSYLLSTKREEVLIPEARGAEMKSEYACQGCDGCNGCNSCE